MSASMFACATCDGWGHEVDLTVTPAETKPCTACGGSGAATADEVLAWLLDPERKFSPAESGWWRLGYEECDCGDGYGCPHPAALTDIGVRNRWYTDGEKWPRDEFGVTELGDLTIEDAALMAAAPLLLARLREALS